MTAPTMADARRAAERIVVGHGASKVLLFGSVARGDAIDSSDIDLVVVFDDLGDYRKRFELHSAAAAAAREAAGCEVDVRITDHPEWQHRSQAVVNCFEHHIAKDTVTLVDIPTGSVNWNKEIGMPDCEQAEADRHLSGMSDDLRRIESQYLPESGERAAELAGRSGVEDLTARRRSRHKRLCSDAAMCVEHGLKALVAMCGEWPHRTHDSTTLIAQIAPEHRILIEAVPKDVLTSLGVWRQAGTYEAIFETKGLSDDDLCALAERHIDAAIVLTANVIAVYEKTYPDLSQVAARLVQDHQIVHGLRITIRLWDGSELN